MKPSGHPSECQCKACLVEAIVARLRAEMITGTRPPMQSLTAAETAQRLSVSTKKVYEMCGSGRLRCIRLGRTIRIPSAAVDELLTPNVEAI